MGITVTVTEEPQHATVAAEPFRCPRCGTQAQARVEVSWMVRRAWGLPMRAGMVRSTWTCAACDGVTTRDGGTNALPPFSHQFGGVIFLAGTLGAMAIAIAVVFLAAVGGRSEYAERQAAMDAQLAPLNQRAVAMAELGKARVESCTRAVDAAIAKALPDGTNVAKPRATSALTSAKLVELPVYPAYARRDTVGWPAKAPRACHIEVPFETSYAVERGFEPSRDTAASAQQKLLDYLAAVMKVATPAEVVFVDGNGAAAVISTTKGELLAFGRAVGDDRYSDRFARRLARRSR